MSQLKQFAPGEHDPLDRPIRSIDDLVEYFIDAQRSPSEFRVGTEHERFAVTANSHIALPFSGERSIESLLRGMAQKSGWTAVEEKGHVVALLGPDASVTLEPGGQVELSGAAFKTIHETAAELYSYEKILYEVAGPMGIEFFMMGFHPLAYRGDISWVPKERYAIMQQYMPKRGSRGLDMMLRTCTVQANLDYADEVDMVNSFQMALSVSPIVTALFAASPFKEGQLSGALSERTRVWTDTDPDRSGFPSVVFEENFGYEAWVNWALDVPMYFIRRDDRHFDVAGASFRTFMKEGLLGHQATVRDFADHLTTIFTEVRIKPYLEMRSADCGPSDQLVALPALWKGLVYDHQARAEAVALMDSPSTYELFALQSDAALDGFKAKYREHSLQYLSENLLDIASAGLSRLHCVDDQGRDESIYLRPLVERVQRGETYAEFLVKNQTTLL